MIIENYLIDPYALEAFLMRPATAFEPFKTVRREPNLKSIYAILSEDIPEDAKTVTMIEAVYPPSAEYPDCVYVDEEARLFGYDYDHAWFCIKEHPSPISGRGLVCGADAEGKDTAPASINLGWLRDNVRFGWKDYEAGFDGMRLQVTQSPGCHVLDRWAHEGRINLQRGMEDMGLATYGSYYAEDRI